MSNEHVDPGTLHDCILDMQTTCPKSNESLLHDFCVKSNSGFNRDPDSIQYCIQHGKGLFKNMSECVLFTKCAIDTRQSEGDVIHA